MKEINTGIKGRAEKVVEYGDTAAALGNGKVEVLSTPHLLHLVELACVNALSDSLEGGEATVGFHIDMKHLSATPVGMKVIAEAELAEVKGRGKMFVFNVSVHDENGVAGEATHTRALVNLDKFLK